MSEEHTIQAPETTSIAFADSEGHALLMIHKDGSVTGSIEGASAAGAMFVESVRGHVRAMLRSAPGTAWSYAIEDIAAERASQIEKGWTPEHDDEHGFGHLMNLALGRIRNELLPPSREELVQAAALIVAGIEWMDRNVPDRTDGSPGDGAP